MATNNGRGIPTLPSTLIRPTSPNPDPSPAGPEASQLDGDEPDGPVDGQGRGDQRASALPRPRRKKVTAPAEKTNKRGLHLTDSVWDRLQYEAIRKRTTVSAIAGELLDRTLPRFKIEREA